jgi:hypothetical protein
MGGFFAFRDRLDGSHPRWPILSLIHAIRHIASGAELWFMWPGFSGCSTPEQDGAHCGPRSQIEVEIAPCCGVVAAVHGAGRPTRGRHPRS